MRGKQQQFSINNFHRDCNNSHRDCNNAVRGGLLPVRQRVSLASIKVNWYPGKQSHVIFPGSDAREEHSVRFPHVEAHALTKNRCRGVVYNLAAMVNHSGERSLKMCVGHTLASSRACGRCRVVQTTPTQTKEASALAMAAAILLKHLFRLY